MTLFHCGGIDAAVAKINVSKISGDFSGAETVETKRSSVRGSSSARSVSNVGGSARLAGLRCVETGCVRSTLPLHPSDERGLFQEERGTCGLSFEQNAQLL